MHEVDFHRLNAEIMAVSRHQFGLSDERDAYTGMLIAYQYHNNNEQHLQDLATICERRATFKIAPDVASDYQRLARLAQWRIAQMKKDDK